MSSSWIHGLYLKVLTLNWISTESGYGKGTKDGVGSGIKWGKVFKNEPNKVCGGQPLKNFKGDGLLEANHTPSNFLNAVFHKFYFVHSWILCPKCTIKAQEHHYILPKCNNQLLQYIRILSSIITDICDKSDVEEVQKLYWNKVHGFQK